MNMVMTFVLHPLSHYNSITEPRARFLLSFLEHFTIDFPSHFILSIIDVHLDSASRDKLIMVQLQHMDARLDTLSTELYQVNVHVGHIARRQVTMAVLHLSLLLHHLIQLLLILMLRMMMIMMVMVMTMTLQMMMEMLALPMRYLLDTLPFVTRDKKGK